MTRVVKEVYFWQNSISPHQSQIIRNLSKGGNKKIVWIAKILLDEKRINMGWHPPDTTGIEIHTNPSKSEVIRLLENSSPSSIHIFSGPRGVPMVYWAFKKAVKEGKIIGLISETYDTHGFKGKLRFLRGRYDYLKYKSHIRFILAIGNRGVNWYKQCGYQRKLVMDWGYFPEIYFTPLHEVKNSVFTIVYVGKLLRSKGVIDLVEAVNELIANSIKLQLVIIGQGALKEEIVKKITEYKIDKFVSIKGFKPNREVQLEIGQSDLLVLPSNRKEGWGAVINEALSAGTKALCSDECGASVLINCANGSVFHGGSISHLKEKMETIIDQGPLSKEERSIISNAYRKLSAEIISQYMESIFEYVLAGYKIPKPRAPWT